MQAKIITYCLNLYAARDPPPSYYDVMGISQMKNDIGAAKEESNNPAVMIFKVCCICIGSCKQSHYSCVLLLSCVYFALVLCTGIVFILFGALPISLLVVGKLYNVVQVIYLVTRHTWKYIVNTSCFIASCFIS